ncbi:MAG TPA: UDP-N-acetylglucosamine--N-acetylmuramyl-(pentapeptide) pyrophosphoryl-undecaprenol N-acetylglucosamine transferase, partial [Gemmatimonadaceae bacterium]|nr:UDP-N-acetylglucosamine--N-acetylmuramyl-(pentapeptide) pyrophosphoryl-undecaprenol N-acetylglucosamine transferase [Gemmatimonadaceae bacterium]
VAQCPELDIMFIGAERGIERTILPTTRWQHALLDLHPLYRSRPWENWKTLRGMVSAFSSLRKQAARKPAVGVLGTGGYAAGALLGYARTNSIPFFLQEQNAVAGLTVRFFSSAARSVFVGFPEAIDTLPERARRNTFVTGNPIAPPPSPLPERAAGRAAWGFPATVERVLLVFGGSQGSRAINDAAAAWLPSKLPPTWAAIWVTGRGDFERHVQHASERVRIIPYQQPMAQAYATVDLAVARAGAMSTAELCAWGIPMVLVPLPTAAADHQRQNAEALAAADAARLVSQDMLAGGELSRVLDALCDDPAELEAMGRSARARARVDASQVIAKNILASLNLK